jgi:hypothetical protein
LAAKDELVATAATIEESCDVDPCSIGGLVGAILVTVGRATALVGTGVLHAMHRAIIVKISRLEQQSTIHHSIATGQPMDALHHIL